MRQLLPGHPVNPHRKRREREVVEIRKVDPALTDSRFPAPVHGVVAVNDDRCAGMNTFRLIQRNIRFKDTVSPELPPSVRDHDAKPEHRSTEHDAVDRCTNDVLNHVGLAGFDQALARWRDEIVVVSCVVH